ncbi:MAG: hypothetical protein E7Z99_08920 [Coriobacteriaceae bacterium]|nr:hypothetical protein [Coriobacteriaceae bacterium]
MSWYHFGFAFFWAFYSTGAYGNAAVAQAATQMFGGVDQTSIFACSVLQQASLIVALVVFAFLDRSRDKVDWRFGWVLGVAVGLGYVMRWVAPSMGNAQMVVACVGAITVGVASAGFMLAWQSFFANEGAERAMVFVPLSAVLSVVFSVVLSALPAVVVAVCLVLLLPAAASASLMLCLREMQPYQAQPFTAASARALVSDTVLPVVCVCVVGFVWKVVARLNGAISSMEAFAVAVGMVVAALLVAAMGLFQRRDFDIMRIYQFIFPIVTGALLLPVFLGGEWMPFLSSCLMCGFEVLNLILIITCAAYAHKHSLKASQVYVPCVGLSLVAMFAGDLAGFVAGTHALLDMTIMAGALFACAYLLALVMSIVSFAQGKRARADASADAGVIIRNAEAVDTAQTGVVSPSEATEPERPIDKREQLEGAIAELGPAEPVSKRELDVLEMYLQGYNVPTTAQKLFISENTVRSHTKNLYRKFGVHSRQELIELFSA